MIIPLLATMTSLLTQGEKTVDFGADGVGGYPVVEIADVKGPTRVRVWYATHPDGLRGGWGDFRHETRATYMGPEVWLPIHPANTDRWDWFDVTSNGTYRAACAQGLVRYACWTVESGAGATVKAIGFDNDGIHSEEPVVGSFACSDDGLTKVWGASVRTCQLAAIPGRDKPIHVAGGRLKKTLGPSYCYLSDGAKRDRLVWSGDLWWAQRNMYVAFPIDSPYMPGSIRMLGENQTPEGYTQACPHPESHGPLKDGDWGPFGSDEFAAWFVPVVYDHYLYTADEAVTREAFPRVRKLLGYLRKHCRADGFLEPRKETCKHAAGLTFGGTSLHHRTYMNILLWKTYVDAAALADVFGTAAEAAEWRGWAKTLAANIRAQQWDAEKGWFIQSNEERKWGEEANPLALATRFATADEAARVIPQLKYHSHGKFQAMALRGAYEYGADAKALALFNQHNWRKLFSSGWKGLHTVTECMGLGTNGWGDEAHPDTAVAGILTNYILGVEPLAPGYAKFRVKPQTAGVTWAKGRVPTPHGFIDVSWKLVDGRPAVEVTAPAPCTRVE